MATRQPVGRRIAPDSNAGFTLLEVITVLVIIAVLATVAVSRFQGDSGYAEYTARQRLIAALRYVQMQAMQDTRAGFCHRIVFAYGANDGFGPSTASYNPGDQSASCSTSIDTDAPQNLQIDSSALSAKGVILSSQEAFGATVAFIGFDEDGGVLTNNYNCALSPPCRITFSGEAEVAVCVENSGYIYAC